VETTGFVSRHFSAGMVRKMTSADDVIMMSVDDLMTLPLDLVMRTGRRRSEEELSPTRHVADNHPVSSLSSSPQSSPAAASETGIDTASDVSSSYGDPPRFTVMPAATTATSPPLFYHHPCGDHIDMKPEPYSTYRPSCELSQQVRHTIAPMLPRSNFQHGVTVGYTYEAFIATDGRSRRRKKFEEPLPGTVPQGELQRERGTETTTTTTSAARRTSGRYTCCDCGRFYATSSNLSRHKQTHRSLDSRYARACPHCHKPYVSMPALAMHVLTHDLKLVAASSTLAYRHLYRHCYHRYHPNSCFIR